MTTTQDHYEVLQVSPTADPDVIQAAYRRLAQKWHPDRNPGDWDASDRMRAINEAYRILSDPSCRRVYDAHRKTGSSESFKPPTTPAATTPTKENAPIQMFFSKRTNGELAGMGIGAIVLLAIIGWLIYPHLPSSPRHVNQKIKQDDVTLVRYSDSKSNVTGTIHNSSSEPLNGTLTLTIVTKQWTRDFGVHVSVPPRSTEKFSFYIGTSGTEVTTWYLTESGSRRPTTDLLGRSQRPSGRYLGTQR